MWSRGYHRLPWETPSPESMTIPVVRPEAYRERTAWMATYMAGILKVSNMIWVIPVGDDSMLYRVLEGKDTSLGLGLVSNIGILLSHTNHHTLVARTTNNGGEDSTGSIVSSKASLAHT